MLIEEAKDDPIKKAGIIRDMVESIAKIPDLIKQEVYVRECAGLMGVSEQVLFGTLAQIQKKELYEGQKVERRKATMQVNNTPEAVQKRSVSKLETLEHDLIKNLLLYGNRECTFTDTILTETEDGNLEEQTVQQTLKIYERYS